MNAVTKTLLAALIIVLFLVPESKAQEAQASNDQELNIRAYEQLLRADIDAKRETIIKEIMEFSDSEAKVFWPIFRKYDMERKQLDQAEAQLVSEYAEAYQNISDEKADQLLSKSFELEAQRARLKKKYFDMMKKALSPRVAAKFFEVENQIQNVSELQWSAKLPANQ